MKSLNLLKTLVDLFLFVSLLAAFAVLIAVPVKIFNPDMDMPMSIGGNEVTADSWWSVLMIAFSGLGAFFFIYAVFILRKVLQAFSKREIFDVAVISNFKLIGKCIIASTLLTSVPMFFYRMIEHNNVDLKIEANGFNSMILSISLGLLFIVIGEIFQIAKNIKEENDLTV